MSLIESGSFAQLDLVLCPSDFANSIQDIYSTRSKRIASRHFLLQSILHIEVAERAGERDLRSARKRFDVSDLQDEERSK
eukprot:3892865-Karenia_brevis.AAC.1